jgi:ABC-type lipoprotein export system ATPase subunit
MNIHKTCRIGEAEYPVLKRINMEIESGEVIATPGSSSGKSTLMKIVGCLDWPHR